MGYTPKVPVDRAGEPLVNSTALMTPPGHTWERWRSTEPLPADVEEVLLRDTPGDCVFMDESDGCLNVDFTLGGLLPDFSGHPSLEVSFGGRPRRRNKHMGPR